MAIIKIILILIVLALMALPFIPLRWALSYSYYLPPVTSRKKGVVSLIIMACVASAFIITMPQITKLAMALGSLGAVRWLLDKIPGQARYSTQLAVLIFTNILYNAVTLFVLMNISAFGSLLARLFAWIKKKLEPLKIKLPGTGDSKSDETKKGKKAKDKTGNKTEEGSGEKTDPDNKTQNDSKNGTGGAKDGKPSGGSDADKTVVTLPPELLPEPEPMPSGGSVLIDAGTRSIPAQKVDKHDSSKEKSTPDSKGKPSGGSAEGAEDESTFRRLMRKVRDLICETVEEKRFVKPQYRHTAKHLQSFLRIVFIIYLVVFLLLLIPSLFAFSMLEKPLYTLMRMVLSINYLYPMMSLAMLLAISRLIDGEAAPVPKEAAAEMEKAAQRVRVVDLNALENAIMKTCGKNYEVNSFFSSDVDPDHSAVIPDAVMQNSMVQGVCAYVRSRKLELNHDYILGVKAFSEGSDVLFHAPIYTAVGAYVYPLINARLLQGERVIVICHNRSEIPTLITRMQENFVAVNRSRECLWRITAFEGKKDYSESDIIVFTSEDFRDHSLFLENEALFATVGIALLPDSDKVVSANNYYCQVISQRLKQFCKPSMQYLFLSARSIKNLHNALVEFFMLGTKPFEARGDYGYGDIHVFTWKNRSDDAVFVDNAANTLALEVNICTIASKYGIPKPQVISDGAIYPNQVDRQWLEIYDSSENPIGFLVVADDKFYLPGVIHAYSRYIGKKASVLHVITHDYLLRDYFYANAARYLFEEPMMGHVMLEHAAADKSSMILLLCRLLTGLPFEEFKQQMQSIDPKFADFGQRKDDIDSMVAACLEMALGHAPSSEREQYTLYTPVNDFYPALHIRINENIETLDALLKDTELVELHFSGGRLPVRIPLFKRMLDQRYLKGQVLIYDNHVFTINAIDRFKGIVTVDDADTNHGNARDYIQLREYTVKSAELIEECGLAAGGLAPLSQKPGAVITSRLTFSGEENLVAGLIQAKLTDEYELESDTVGYYILREYTESLRVTDSAVEIIRRNDAERDSFRRSVTKALYIKLELNRERDDRLTMTLAALMQEMLKSFFPDYYFCLSVCPILEEPDEIYENPDAKSRMIAQLYPKLLGWSPEKVSEKSIELLVVDDCKGGTGALDLLFHPEGTFLKNMFWMLSDLLDWEFETGARSYLFFGMDRQPDIFDFNGLRCFLHDFAHATVRQHDINKQLDGGSKCPFCSKPIADGMFVLDGRMICDECAKQYVPNEAECGSILAYITDHLNKTFSIELEKLSVSIGESGDALSLLEYDARRIVLRSKLPLSTVHEELLRQTVCAWQLDNLEITADVRLKGQEEYVLLQYLKHIEQHMRLQRHHRSLLLNTKEAGEGFRLLSHELQSEGHSNSFVYLLGLMKKGTTPVPWPKPDPDPKPKPDPDPAPKPEPDPDPKPKPDPDPKPKPDPDPKPKPDPDPKRSRRKAGKAPCYFREKLSDAHKRIYDKLLECMLNLESNVDLSEETNGPNGDGKVPNKVLYKIHDSVMHDHPELFYISAWAISSTSFSPTYCYSPEQIVSMRAEIDAAIDQFTSGITDTMTDWEIALSLYERMTELLDYDSIALEHRERFKGKLVTSDSDGTYSIYSAYGALVNRKAVCAGYAHAYQMMLQRYGIEAIYITGDCHEGGGHAWNIVKLDGDHSHVDVTWGDRSNTMASKNHAGMTHAYFGLTDDEICTSRSIDRNLKYPACTSTRCNYFVRMGLRFDRYDSTAVRNAVVDHLRAHKELKQLELSFGNKALLEVAKQQLIENRGIFAILSAAGLSGYVHSWTYSELGVIEFALREK